MTLLAISTIFTHMQNLFINASSCHVSALRTLSSMSQRDFRLFIPTRKVMKRASKISVPKAAPGKSQISASESNPGSPNSKEKSFDAFEIQFTECIAKTERLKTDICEKFKNYEKSLTLKKLQCIELESKNHNLSEQVTTLVTLKEKLLKENSEIKSELQQCQEKVKSLLEEKANFNERLKLFINDISEANHSDIAGESFQNIGSKRTFEVEKSSIPDDSCSASKHRKTVDLPTISSTSRNNQNVEDSVEESQPNSDTQVTQTMTAHADSTNSADPGKAHNHHLDAMATMQEIENPIQEKRRNFRKNIKRVMDFESLSTETKVAYQQEKERKKEYAQRIQKYNETYGTLPGELNQMDKLLLDYDLNTKSELLAVDRRLSTKLKPHQCQGVKFMWDACFESIEKLQRSNGSGCILGHCMGLGKTLQVITLVHTLLTHSVKTKVAKVLIICPTNVILNWVDQFDVWLKEFPEKENLKIYEFSCCNSGERARRMTLWHKNGGVFIIGYRMFQKGDKGAKDDNFRKAFVDPGADLVVCDEGHLLKNPTSQLSLAVNKIRTLRRIILTGTPLQNNLKEYFTMVEFVKPRLLGTEQEFSNRFVGPIVNGQFIDSTDADIQLMKYRACILHKLLDGCVQRRDYTVLAEFLPPKQEFVLFIRLAKVQIDLYKFYMKNIVKGNPVADLPALRRLCNHPKALADCEERRKLAQSKAHKAVAQSQSDDDSDPETASNVPPTSDNECATDEWWKPICNGDKLELSGKMSVFFSILAECEERGEKMLVFSGSLSTLNVLEELLATGFKGNWTRGVDYLRLDGTVNVERRRRDITTFNKDSNKRARLFLISTRAGGLGINLMAANRVILFDASWNPSDDIQSIFRTYRIGQAKECFVYRFIALGTMEERIYDRQVTKLGIAKRVIDEHEIDRHYKEEDLQQLYCVKNLEPSKSAVKHQPAITLKDNLLKALLQKHRDVIFKYHDHDSLLQNMTDESLTDQEIGDVWEAFETSTNDK